MLTPEQMEKLPKWAQVHINQLQMRHDELLSDLSEIFSKNPSNVQYPKNYMSDVMYNLPNDSRVHFRFGKGTWDYYEVGMKDEGILSVRSGNYSLVVLPKFSNEVQIKAVKP